MLGFLDLPAELRSHIYEDVLEDAKGPVWQEDAFCHYAASLPNPQFDDYINFLCTNSRVNAELSDACDDKYLQSVTWRFENPSDLFGFVDRKHTTRLGPLDLEFGLRVSCSSPSYIITDRLITHRHHILHHFALQKLSMRHCNHLPDRRPEWPGDSQFAAIARKSAVAEHHLPSYTCPHGNSFETMRHMKYPSLTRYRCRRSPRLGNQLTQICFVDRFGPSWAGPFRLSIWVEGRVKEITREYTQFIEPGWWDDTPPRRDKSVAEDEIGFACELSDRRKLEALRRETEDGEGVLDGFAKLFSEEAQLADKRKREALRREADDGDGVLDGLANLFLEDDAVLAEYQGNLNLERRHEVKSDQVRPRPTGYLMITSC